MTTKTRLELHLESTDYQRIASLYSWSTNYAFSEGPFALFLDIIGYTTEEFGDTIYSPKHYETMGHIEISALADALKEYSDQSGAYEYVYTLIELEARDPQYIEEADE